MIAADLDAPGPTELARGERNHVDRHIAPFPTALLVGATPVAWSGHADVERRRGSVRADVNEGANEVGARPYTTRRRASVLRLSCRSESLAVPSMDLPPRLRYTLRLAGTFRVA